MQNFSNYINTALKDIYEATEIRSFAHLIIENVTGMTRTDIIVNKNTIFSDANRQIMNSFVDKLKKNMPIQYVLGKTYFYNAEFNVSSHVLIPRPETEELVDWVLKDFCDKPSPLVLDIGTGSGCIAISIKKALPKAKVWAFDVSDKALEMAQQNALYNNVDVNFQYLDILNATQQPTKWDCIVSNPPYIPEIEKGEILPNVIDYEPHLALFVPSSDPLLFYNKIAVFALQHLNFDGRLYFEIHRTQGIECVAMLNALGYKNIELKKDIFGNDRMIRAQI